MSIDTLNAYCGLWFVHRPCLAQGRFVIHPASCWHWASPSAKRVASSLTVRDCARSADSRVSAWVSVKLLRLLVRPEENFEIFLRPLFSRPESRQCPSASKGPVTSAQNHPDSSSASHKSTGMIVARFSFSVGNGNKTSIVEKGLK